MPDSERAQPAAIPFESTALPLRPMDIGRSADVPWTKHSLGDYSDKQRSGGFLPHMEGSLIFGPTFTRGEDDARSETGIIESHVART
jgi:hypothetical protein